MVSELEAERLYRIKKWVADKEIQWEPRNNKLYLQATVVAEDGTELSVRASKNKKFSFCLLYRNAIPIRRFDFYESHTNTDGTKIIGGRPHKHKWDGLKCDYAYEVDDIDICDVNEGLFNFFAECNIEFSGIIYQTILVRQKE